MNFTLWHTNLCSIPWVLAGWMLAKSINGLKVDKWGLALSFVLMLLASITMRVIFEGRK